MKYGNLKIIFFILILIKSTFIFAEEKIQSVPLINLDELLPTFEEEKQELEKKDFFFIGGSEGGVFSMYFPGAISVKAIFLNG